MTAGGAGHSLRSMSPRRRRATAVLLLAAALGGALWLGFAPHTDDGCQTEIHCLACRTAFTRAAVTAPAHGVAVALAPLGTAHVAPPAPVADGPRSVVSSRGPPLFA